ncbi:MAG: tetratricopeptide repeat protein [Flavobacteriaceae bacterium]
MNKFYLGAALLVASLSFSQKNEIKAAEKALKTGSFSEAKSTLSSAESIISAADAKTQAKFYYLKAKAFYGNAAKPGPDLKVITESINKVKSAEGSSKGKYTVLVSVIESKLLNDIITVANNTYQDKSYLKSSEAFETAYSLSPSDTLYLYYAASTAVTAPDYDLALKHYVKLRELGYYGQETIYKAVNKTTGEVETFESEQMRDFSIKSKSHNSPTMEKTKPKSAEIIKNISLIYISKGDNQQAVKYIQEARLENPDDLDLLFSEANVQLKLNNKQAFKDLMIEATKKDPKNPELQYNLGVITSESGDNKLAETYYRKAIELDPEYADAYLNLAAVILQQEEPLVEEMNKLGTSRADNLKYDKLLEQRQSLYKSAIPFLSKRLELKPKDIDAARTLMNIYSVIGDTAKFKEIKAIVDALN